jgi:hypothetical protein
VIGNEAKYKRDASSRKSMMSASPARSGRGSASTEKGDRVAVGVVADQDNTEVFTS